MQNPTDLSGTAPVAAAEARAFYRYFLAKDGWSESPQDPNNSSSVDFRKDGSTITAHFYDAGEGKTNFNLHHAGSFDVRRTPKADAVAIKIVFENAASSSYRAKAGMLHSRRRYCANYTMPAGRRTRGLTAPSARSVTNAISSSSTMGSHSVSQSANFLTTPKKRTPFNNRLSQTTHGPPSPRRRLHRVRRLNRADVDRNHEYELVRRASSTTAK